MILSKLQEPTFKENVTIATQRLINQSDMAFTI